MMTSSDYSAEGFASRELPRSDDEIMNGEVSQLDVARAAGVSQSAVSRAFTPGANVSDETRRHVMDVAQRLHYRPNAIARSLVTRRTNMVAVIMANLTNPFYPLVLDRFVLRLQESGYRVLLFRIPDLNGVDDALLRALQYQVDGIIMTSAVLSSRMADVCSARGIPVVLFNRYELESRASAVCSDNREGGRMVADGLLRARYRRLALVAGQEGSSTSHDREAGFIGRLGEQNGVTWVREPGDYSYESGRLAAGRLLARNPRPEAVFCANDLMAFGVMDAARFDFDLRVPADLAVVGFDDVPMAAWPTYSLTTVRQPVDRLIDATIQVLTRAMEQPEDERVLRVLPCQLIVRNSALAPSDESICH